MEGTDKQTMESLHIHTGSVTHLDESPVVHKVKKEKEKLLKDRTCVHNDDDTIRIIDDEFAKAVPPDGDALICGCKEGTFRVVSGLILVVLIAVAWTGATQFGRSTYVKDFHSPYFTGWFSLCFQVSMYPIFMIPLLCQKTPFRIRTYLRQTTDIFGKRGFCLRSVLLFVVRYAIPFNIINLLGYYLYYRSLKTLNPGTVSSVFASQSTFVYILSLLILGDKFFLLRASSVILSVGGIVLMGHSEGFDNLTTIGILFAALAALTSAIFQVAFKRLLGKATSGQVALFFTIIGLTNLLLFSPFIFLLDYFKLEQINWTDVPWGALAGTALLQLVFNYLVSFGIAFTYPLYISIGALIGVPFNAVVDAIVRDADFGMYKIIAFFIIIVGFLLLLIPIRKVERIEKKMRCAYKTKRKETTLELSEVQPEGIGDV